MAEPTQFERSFDGSPRVKLCYLSRYTEPTCSKSPAGVSTSAMPKGFRKAWRTEGVCGGGDRTRTCKPLRAAVFKTAALPIMLPLRSRRLFIAQPKRFLNFHRDEPCRRASERRAKPLGSENDPLQEALNFCANGSGKLPEAFPLRARPTRLFARDHPLPSKHALAESSACFRRSAGQLFDSGVEKGVSSAACERI